MKINYRELGKLLVAIVICQLAGIIGAFFTSPAIPTWYASLDKPFFTPPGWLFGPVWITLYTLMGISLYLIWQKQKHKDFKVAITIFGGQLFLNAIWSPIFFGAQNILAGFVVIIALWIAVLATMKWFYKIDKNATYLLIPYIAWLTLAAVLNYSLLILN